MALFAESAHCGILILVEIPSPHRPIKFSERSSNMIADQLVTGAFLPRSLRERA